MKIISAEKLIEKLDCDIYPVAIIKFILNKRKILYCFSRAADPDFQIRGNVYTTDILKCDICREKEEKGMLCRQHTSLDRILKAEKVAYDIDTNCYFYKNEIFRMIGDKLVVIYCPHTKLIVGDITDAKVRKVIPVTFYDKTIKLPKFKIERRFVSSELMSKHLKAWFNYEFSIVTIPKDMDESNFCLIPNK